jgi:hypothetical protein
VLSPLVAEFLLGDFSVRQLGLLIFLFPQYGSGALLVRETARRAGKGWPSIIFLALAYALIEEGLTTQSLFNPNYAALRLLDYGFIPVLGTSLDWAVFVLTLHVVWSVASCIAIAEGLAGTRGSTPWLGRLGLAVIVFLFLLGCTLTTIFTLKTFPFVATRWQFAVVVIASVGSIFAALKIPKDFGTRINGSVPLWLPVVASLVLCSSFYLLYERGTATGLHPAVALVGMLALEIVAIVLFAVWSRRSGWGPGHVVAAATGAILTYGWHGIARMISGSTALGVPTTSVDIIGQFVLLLIILAIVALAFYRAPHER